mgnify:CR=1 FL=1
MEYLDFLKQKMAISAENGFEVSDDELTPSLFPHVKDTVKWAVKGGQRAIFSSFGMQKTVTQLEILRIIAKREGGKCLVVCPRRVVVEFEEQAQKHLHLPVQSGSSEVLRRMNRRYTVEKYMETVDMIRSRDPDFSLTTDLIVGFPDESDEDFKGTLDIVRRVKYDNIYSFIYSKRSGTPAATMADGTSEEEKGRRMRKLLEVQREVSTEHYKRFVGRTMRVLAEDRAKKKEGWLTGKSSEFIIVEFEGDSSLIGQFVDVEITGSMNWAVTGKIKG